VRAPARVGFGLGLALAIGAAGCGPGPVTLPTPPMQAETAQLVATYQMPTAVLDTSNIDQALSDAQARLAQLQLDWLPDVVSDALVGLAERLHQSDLPTSPSTSADTRRAQLTAVVTLNRICGGAGSAVGPADASASGSLDVTAIVDTGTLHPEIWGTATSCQTQVQPTAGASGTLDVTLDGTLIIYLLGPLPTSVTNAQLLITFTGSLGASGQTVSGSFDFEIVNTSVKFRIPAGGGDAIVTVGTTLGIEGANAGFSCDLTSLTCTQSS
jgi:hypothetical protein